MIRRWLIRFTAVTSIAVCVVIAALDAVRGWPSGGSYLLYGAIAIVFLGVGWLIAERKPSNAVGLLLLAFGALFAWYLPADLYLHLPGNPPAAELAALFVSVLDAPMFILIALVLILFPDGRLPSPRWRWTLVAGLFGIGLAVVGHVLQPGPLQLFPRYSNPVGVAGFPGIGLVFLAYVVMMVLLVAAAVALVIRWRRGTAIERAQVKWVVAAAITMVVAEVINIATFRPEEQNAVTTIIASLAIALVPIAMGIAILRYRLYEIDRIISRSLSYAVVSGILGAVFVAAILFLQEVFARFTQGQTVAVAASTLVVFALFQPLRRRVQTAVDRRFDRARYDGQRMADAFAGRLRDEVDIATVTTDLDATVRAAVRPTVLGLWVRGPK